VSNFSSDQHDLLELWLNFLASVEADGGHIDNERYFLPQKVQPEPRTRTARAEFDTGRTGERQTVRDTTDGTEVGQIRRRDTATAPLRSLIDVPENSRVAYMALEVAGLRSVLGHLSSSWKRDFRDRTRGMGFVLKILNLNDAAAWQQFLDQSDLAEVTFRKLVRPQGDRSAQPRIEEYTTRAPDGGFLPKGLLDGLLRRRVQPSDVLSVDIGDPDQVRVVVDSGGRRRTLQVGQPLPSFTYEIEPGSTDRPVSSQFYAVARELIDGQLAVDGAENPRAARE
jgi:hypothetical protein